MTELTGGTALVTSSVQGIALAIAGAQIAVHPLAGEAESRAVR